MNSLEEFEQSYEQRLEQSAFECGWESLQEQAEHLVAEKWPASKNIEEIACDLIEAAVKRKRPVHVVINERF